MTSAEGDNSQGTKSSPTKAGFVVFVKNGKVGDRVKDKVTSVGSVERKVAIAEFYNTHNPTHTQATENFNQEQLKTIQKRCVSHSIHHAHVGGGPQNCTTRHIRL